MVDSNSLCKRKASGAATKRYSPLNVSSSSTSGSGSGSGATTSRTTASSTGPHCPSAPSSSNFHPPVKAESSSGSPPKSNLLSDPVAGPGMAPRRRRNRAVLSCLKCHTRRVKCDRKQPCGACIRYGAPEDCHVPDNPKAHEERRRIAAAAAEEGSSDGFDDALYATTSDESGGHPAWASAPMSEFSGFPIPYVHDSTQYLLSHPHSVAPSPGPDAYHGSLYADSGGADHAQSSYIAPSPLMMPGQFPPHIQSLSHEGHFLSATSGSSSPFEDYASHGRSSSAHYGLVPPPTAPSGGSGGWNSDFSISRADLDFPQRPYTANRPGDMLSRFITEYETQVSTDTIQPPPPRQYSPAEVEEIFTFCDALPSRDLEAIVRSYINDIEWIHAVVEPDSIMCRFMPDLVNRLLDPNSSGAVVNSHREGACHLRFGDMARLCLLGAMVLCSIQATSEDVLKLTFRQTPTGTTSISEPGSVFRLKTEPDSSMLSHHYQIGLSAIASSSTHSFGSGAANTSGTSDSSGVPAQTQPPVKDEILGLIEAQTRHLIQRAEAVEGSSTDLIKARIIFIHSLKNEARMAHSNSFELLRETTEMAMSLNMHKDPEYLMISNDEKEDRRRLFYTLYSLDRSTALYFCKQPRIAEADVETNLPQEHRVVDGKEQLHSFIFLRAKLSKIITRIGAASLQVPVDGDAIHNLDMQLQELVQMTQGTPFHPSLTQLQPELNKFHTLDRQRHLFLICYHSTREALHRLAFFEGPRISQEHVAYSREECAKSAIALLETQRSLRVRINSTADLCCFYIPLFTLEPAITLIISSIVLFQKNPNLALTQGPETVQEQSAKKVKVDLYLEWAQNALDLLRSMPETVEVAAQGSYLLSRVLRKAVAIVNHHLNPRAADGDDHGTAGVSAHERRLAAAISLERTSAWMQELFCDENGRRMDMPYITPSTRSSRFKNRIPPPPAPRSTAASEPYRDASSPASVHLYLGSGSSRKAMPPAASVHGGADASTRNAMESIKLATQALHLNPTQAPQPEQHHHQQQQQQPMPSSAPGPPFISPMSSVPASSAAAAAVINTTSSSGFVTAPASVTSHDATVHYDLASSDFQLQFGQSADHFPASGSFAPTGQLDLGIEAGPSLSDLGLGFLDTFMDASRHQFGSLNNNISNINMNNNDTAMGETSTTGLGQLSLATTTATTTTTHNNNIAAAAGEPTATHTADFAAAAPGQAGLEAYMNEYLAAIRRAP